MFTAKFIKLKKFSMFLLVTLVLSQFVGVGTAYACNIVIISTTVNSSIPNDNQLLYGDQIIVTFNSQLQNSSNQANAAIQSAAFQSLGGASPLVSTTDNMTYTITIQSTVYLPAPKNIVIPAGAIISTLDGAPNDSNIAFKVSDDTIHPRLVKAEALNNHTVNLIFSEPMDAAQTNDPYHYSLTPYLGLASAAIQSDPCIVQLTTVAPIETGTNYYVSAYTSLTDLAGNNLSSMYCMSNFTLAPPSPPSPEPSTPVPSTSPNPSTTDSSPTPSTDPVPANSAGNKAAFKTNPQDKSKNSAPELASSKELETKLNENQPAVGNLAEKQTDKWEQLSYLQLIPTNGSVVLINNVKKPWLEEPNSHTIKIDLVSNYQKLAFQAYGGAPPVKWLKLFCNDLFRK